MLFKHFILVHGVFPGFHDDKPTNGQCVFHNITFKRYNILQVPECEQIRDSTHPCGIPVDS